MWRMKHGKNVCGWARKRCSSLKPTLFSGTTIYHYCPKRSPKGKQEDTEEAFWCISLIAFDVFFHLLLEMGWKCAVLSLTRKWFPFSVLKRNRNPDEHWNDRGINKFQFAGAISQLYFSFKRPQFLFFFELIQVVALRVRASQKRD